MDASDLVFLQSADGRRHLTALAATPITDGNHLALVTRLRREVSAREAHALLETARLRQKASVKFSHAGAMFFTAHGLEMSSAEPIAAYRAARFAGLTPIADLGCGIGGDAIALTAHGDVIGVDKDPLHLALAAANVAAYGRGDRFTPRLADLTALTPFPVAGVFFDPARRDASGRRLYSLHAYRPPVSLIDRWRSETAAIGIKIGPGVRYAELPTSAEVEFISVDRRLREAVLWYGPLHSGVARRATRLARDGSVVGSVTAADAADDAPPQAPRAYLYEPDPAVIRAHLVRHLAVQLNATRIDDQIAYLSADRLTPTPLATAYRVDDWFPFQLKQLRAYLRARHVGRVVVKKRGSAIDPQALERRLRLKGSAACTLFVTRIAGRPSVIVGQPIAPNGDP